jgi:hypothetical protein
MNDSYGQWKQGFCMGSQKLMTFKRPQDRQADNIYENGILGEVPVHCFKNCLFISQLRKILVSILFFLHELLCPLYCTHLSFDKV